MTIRVYLETLRIASLPAVLTGPEEAFAHDLAHGASGEIIRELLAEFPAEEGWTRGRCRVEGQRAARETLIRNGRSPCELNAFWDRDGDRQVVVEIE